MLTQAQVEKAITYLAPNALVSEIAAVVVAGAAAGNWKTPLLARLSQPDVTRRQRIATLAAVEGLAT